MVNVDDRPIRQQLEETRLRLERARLPTAQQALRQHLRELYAERDRLIFGDDTHQGCVAVVYRQAAGFKAKNTALDLEDLQGAGMIGLVEAAELFDPRLGFKFITYAWRTVWARLVMEAKRQASLLKIPLYAWEEGFQFVAEAEKAKGGGIDINHHYQDDGEAQFGEEPEERPYGFDEIEALNDALRFLPRRWREILRLRYEEHLGLAAIGRRLRISKERVRQILYRALGYLRRRMVKGVPA